MAPLLDVERGKLRHVSPPGHLRKRQFAIVRAWRWLKRRFTKEKPLVATGGPCAPLVVSYEFWSSDMDAWSEEERAVWRAAEEAMQYDIETHPYYGD